MEKQEPPLFHDMLIDDVIPVIFHAVWDACDNEADRVLHAWTLSLVSKTFRRFVTVAKRGQRGAIIGGGAAWPYLIEAISTHTAPLRMMKALGMGVPRMRDELTKGIIYGNRDRRITRSIFLLAYRLARDDIAPATLSPYLTEDLMKDSVFQYGYRLGRVTVHDPGVLNEETARLIVQYETYRPHYWSVPGTPTFCGHIATECDSARTHVLVDWMQVPRFRSDFSHFAAYIANFLPATVMHSLNVLTLNAHDHAFFDSVPNYLYATLPLEERLEAFRALIQKPIDLTLVSSAVMKWLQREVVAARTAEPLKQFMDALRPHAHLTGGSSVIANNVASWLQFNLHLPLNEFILAIGYCEHVCQDTLATFSLSTYRSLWNAERYVWLITKYKAGCCFTFSRLSLSSQELIIRDILEFLLTPVHQSAGIESSLTTLRAAWLPIVLDTDTYLVPIIRVILKQRYEQPWYAMLPVQEVLQIIPDSVQCPSKGLKERMRNILFKIPMEIRQNVVFSSDETGLSATWEERDLTLWVDATSYTVHGGKEFFDSDDRDATVQRICRDFSVKPIG
jgi:hypothetical protein